MQIRSCFSNMNADSWPHADRTVSPWQQNYYSDNEPKAGGSWTAALPLGGFGFPGPSNGLLNYKSSLYRLSWQFQERNDLRRRLAAWMTRQPDHFRTARGRRRKRN